MPGIGRTRLLPVLLVGLMVLALAGCGGQRFVKLRPQPYNPLADRLKLTARGGPQPSERTIQLLRQYALPTHRFTDTETQIANLSALHAAEPSAESCYALAELSYIAAVKQQLINPHRAQEWYLNSVAQAYSYLFDAKYREQRNPYDPQFRGACDLYNSALESCLRIAQQEGTFRPGSTLRVVTSDNTLEVSISARGFRWEAEDFDGFEFVSDFDVEGLKNHYRTFGLGVPLIAVRKNGSATPEVERYYARGLSFPVTAFLRLHTEDPDQPPNSRHLKAELELFDPLELTDVQVAGRTVPLESDLSTPLAYFLNDPDIQKLDTFGLLRPDKIQKIAGLYMVQPYQPGKIPVLMVHGLWSSPMTWMEALNDLRSDPVLREKYQFWFYLYPTGEPFWKSAADLRDALGIMHQTFASQDPGHRLDDMVLVGHSMGGLISRLITYDSGDVYWNSVSNTPFAQVNAPPEVKQQIERVYFFEPNHSVSRVITIASPHRGSEFANNFTRWLGRRLISIPKLTVNTTKQLLELNPGAFRLEESDMVKTSLDSLSPQSPILQAMMQTPPSPDVKYHNIVGITKTNLPVEENTDGVVTYASAHLTDVESEIVVHADHSEAHRHPATIREIRRILLLHLQETQQQRFPVVPLNHQTSATASEPMSHQTAEAKPPILAPPPAPGPLPQDGAALPLTEAVESPFHIESGAVPSP